MRLLGTILLLTACGLRTGTVPGGLICDRAIVANDLAQDLAAAMPRDCVIVTAGTYAGAFMLPADVSLAASAGSTVILKGDGSGKPVLTIRGGRRSTVRGIKIDTTDGTGIAIDPGPADLVGVIVSGNTTHAALTSTCTADGCDEVTIEDSELSTSTTGLLVAGGIVHMVRGRVAQMGGNGLSDGSGVVASKGARVRLEDVTVESNRQVGVLIDGARTQVTLEHAIVRGNLERGVWVQNVSDGGVTLTGGTIDGNALVGLGVRDSAGVTLSAVDVSGTVAVEVPVGIAMKESVGDGVGLFQGARDVLLDQVRFRANARAQVLADGTGAGVRITAADVDGGTYRVVLQHGASVDVAAALIDDPGRVLATKSDAVPVSTK